MKKIFYLLVLTIIISSCQCLPPEVVPEHLGHKLQTCDLSINLDKAGHIKKISHKKDSIQNFKEDIFLFKNGQSLADKLKLSSPTLDKESILYAYKVPNSRLKIRRNYHVDQNQIVARYYFKNRSDTPIQLKWFHTFEGVEKINAHHFSLTLGKQVYSLTFESDGLELKNNAKGFETLLQQIAPNHRVSWKIQIKAQEEK